MSELRRQYECHGHLMMDGADFSGAKKRHEHGVDIGSLRQNLASLRDAGIGYFRDGGDAYGVSAAARKLAGEYEIEYASPVFAIHRRGRYGKILGRSFDDLTEYRALVAEAKAEGADFIKLMFSGIITFRVYGELSCPGLAAEEIRELVNIAHGEGFAVMAHVNGADTVRAAIEAGTDSIEHGYFMDEDCLRTLAASDCIWVPTVAAAAAFLNRDGVARDVVRHTVDRQITDICRAAALGARIACGSDAGAVGVPHGAGTGMENKFLQSAGLTPTRIAADCELLRCRFRPNRKGIL